MEQQPHPTTALPAATDEAYVVVYCHAVGWASA
jgi:hypothetical protein